jgi:murein DD-endopeptidase MepM/ murein hydrolase activator NlpD
MSAGCEYLKAIDESLDAPDVQEDVQKAAKDIEDQVNDWLEEGEQALQSLSPSSSGWSQPLAAGYTVSQPFGQYYDVKQGYHLGADLWASGDEVPVRAVFEGTVIESSFKGFNGYVVVVKHEVEGQTFYSAYCHLRTDKEAAAKGSVKAGDIIGYMGDSSTEDVNPHLHLAIYAGKSALKDPYGYADKEYDGSGYIDYKKYRFYDPITVISGQGQLIMDNPY